MMPPRAWWKITMCHLPSDSLVAPAHRRASEFCIKKHCHLNHHVCQAWACTSSESHWHSMARKSPKSGPVLTASQASSCALGSNISEDTSSSSESCRSPHKTTRLSLNTSQNSQCISLTLFLSAPASAPRVHLYCSPPARQLVQFCQCFRINCKYTKARLEMTHILTYI